MRSKFWGLNYLFSWPVNGLFGKATRVVFKNSSNEIAYLG
jgi:hypothetical protein